MSDHAILLFKGRGLVSGLIRWQTRSQYSHAALYIGDGRIIESWQTAGVREKKITDWRDIDVYTVAGIQDEQWEAAEYFMRRELFRGYDWWSVVRFVSRQSLPQNDRWFCSELVFAAMKYAGVELLTRIDPGEVSPGLLSISPRLILKATYGEHD